MLCASVQQTPLTNKGIIQQNQCIAVPDGGEHDSGNCNTMSVNKTPQRLDHISDQCNLSTAMHSRCTSIYILSPRSPAQHRAQIRCAAWL